MTDAIILRRRRLGKTSAREIAANSTYNVLPVLHDRLGNRQAPITFRWGCTAHIPYETQVINSASSIHRVSDKLGFRELLEEHELCPITIVNSIDWETTYMPYPVIVRPGKHAQGRQLYVCQNLEELTACPARRSPHGYYVSEYIHKEAEYRVFIVSGRAVAVARKYPGNPDDVAWNVARGGRFEHVRWDNWPLNVVRRAIEAFNLSGLDFGGVDVMVGCPDDMYGSGSSYVLEINSAPSLTSPYRQQAMSRAFDYIIENGKDTIPLIEERGGYRKFIHPAVCDRAILG